MMTKDTFIIYASFYEPIANLSDEQLGRLFRAIFLYNLNKEVEVQSDIQMAFGFFKNQFDVDNRRYQKRVEQNRLNGKKGGNPNFIKGQANPYYDKDNPILANITKDNQSVITKDNQTLPNISHYEYEYDNEYEYDYDKGMTVINNSTAITKFDFMNFFNSAMKDANAQIPQIKSLSGEREKFLNARIREYGLDAVKEVIQKAAASNFLNGGGTNGWVADCTWILRPNNFTKILEGNYDNNTQQINTYYDRRQQAKEATLARQNAAIDRIIEEETRKWNEQQQLANGTNVEDISAQSVY